MGNSTSSIPPQNKTSSSSEDPNYKFDNFDNLMDFIATYYILTLDFKSFKKLY